MVCILSMSFISFQPFGCGGWWLKYGYLSIATFTITISVNRHIIKPPIAINKIKVDDGFVGEGYGIPADSTLEAISIAARYEGLLLDPVYSGKGFAGLLSMARGDFFKPTDKVLFLHTGGSSALFAYEDTLVDYVS